MDEPSVRDDSRSREAAAAIDNKTRGARSGRRRRRPKFDDVTGGRLALYNFNSLKIAHHTSHATSLEENKLQQHRQHVELRRAENALDIRHEHIVLLLVDDRLQSRMRLLKRHLAERLR